MHTKQYFWKVQWHIRVLSLNLFLIESFSLIKSFSQLTEKLFARNATFGLDIVALNTQRGRDHGLGSYIAYRSACGFGEAKSFDDLKKDMGKKVGWKPIGKIYSLRS